MSSSSPSTRWESSQRPLLVKSVWTNGHRHVILTKEDPVAKAKRKPSSSKGLRSSKQNSARAKLKSSGDSSDSSSLVIPAVQLLLADVHRLNRNENDKQYPERKKLVKSITFNAISRERSYSPVDENPFGLNELTPSSMHISLSYNLNNNNSNKVQVVERIKSERMEQSSSSLTERVLLWLDLAGKFTTNNNNNNNNNGVNSDENFEEYDDKKPRNMRTRENKRISTAYPSYREKTAQLSAVNQSNVFVRKCTKNRVFTAGNHDSIEIEDLSFENEDDYSILKEPRRIQNSQEQNHNPNREIITSHVEDITDDRPNTTAAHTNCKPSDTHHEQCNRVFMQELSKRQVHIFMPIMKNNVENNSVISCSSTNASM